MSERDARGRTARPKILYTSSDASPQSGAFRCLLDMAVEIRERGFDSVMVLPRGANRASLPPGIRAYTIPMARLRRGRSAAGYASDVAEMVRSTYRLARIIRRERADIVHANEILDGYAGIAARLARVPCVWHVRADVSSWPRPLRIGLARMVWALAGRVIAVSSSVREEVFERQGVDVRKVVVIHDAGPGPATFHPGIDGAAVRRELGVPDGGFLVVLVSKLVEYKGHDVLVRAAPDVLRSFPDTRFAIVGGEVDGEHHRRYAERLRRLPAELGVEDRVAFLGYRGDVARVMAAADVIVHCPTHADPFPGVVLQAMALGKPVVASDMGGAREQVEHEVSGVLVRPGDPLALADAIDGLLKDRERRAALGRVAERAASRFTADAFYDRLIRVYDSVVRR